MTTDQIINVAAIVLSPLIAVLVSLYLQRRNELKDRQFNIFLTLISTRHAIITPDQAKAFNSIDVIFSPSKDVRRLGREYFDLLLQKERMSEWPKKKLELLQAMASEVGYNKNVIDHLDLDRIYSPVGLSELEQTQSRMIKKWEAFLDSAEIVKIEKKQS